MRLKQRSAGLATVLNALKVTKDKVSRHICFIFLQFYIVVQYFPVAVGQRSESTCVSPCARTEETPVSGTQRILQVYFITSCARLQSWYKTDKNVGEVALLG